MAGEGKLVRRPQDRFPAVHTLHSQGLSSLAIARELGLARGTVRRFLRAATVEQVMAVGRDDRPNILDPFKQYLHDRWQHAAQSAAQLFLEIREPGLSRLLHQGSVLPASVPNFSHRSAGGDTPHPKSARSPPGCGATRQPLDRGTAAAQKSARPLHGLRRHR